MEEINAKYDRLQLLLKKTVRPEHAHLLDMMSSIEAKDIIMMLRMGNESLAESQAMIMSAIGLTDEIVDSYDPEAVALILRYIEYFYAISKL